MVALAALGDVGPILLGMAHLARLAATTTETREEAMGKILTYENDFKEFVSTVMTENQRAEIDEEMFYYWLEVLPPVLMNCKVGLVRGETVKAQFGFAEGVDTITAFWCQGNRYFAEKTNLMNG